MKLADYKSENGTSVQAFVHLTAEKAKEAGLISYMIFIDKTDPRKFYAVGSLAEHQIVPALRVVIESIEGVKPVGEKVVLTDVQ